MREATTNVLRHSDAARCAIRLTGTADHVVLVVENDGVLEPDEGTTRTSGAGESGGAGAPDGSDGPGRNDRPIGSGPAGLRERLAALDGSLDAGLAAKGLFQLTAKVPLPQEER
ncbi:hypothetical protein [Streptomyces sp. NBC_01794]|uniref:ATP-binding protein n=1 Tax=Streptomyces sp. NBC_01794 TaxID=2975942 RepID=UPI0030933DD7|nr:hypothetical protein OIE54_22775 [Streptomyces sp. NBC_01794]